MKRLAPLALIVLALAAVPAAFADDTTPPSQPAAAAHVSPRLRLQIVRLRMQVVRLRFQLHCGPNGNAPLDKCVAFAQKVEDRLTTFDGNVQKKLADLKACTTDSTDGTCKNADRKIDLLMKLDERVQKAIANVQSWLDGKGSGSTAAPSSSDSALDQAAADLGQAAGSNG
jgi:hypothetical protein